MWNVGDNNYAGWVRHFRRGSGARSGGEAADYPRIKMIGTRRLWLEEQTGYLTLLNDAPIGCDWPTLGIQMVHPGIVRKKQIRGRNMYGHRLGRVVNREGPLITGPRI